MIHTLRRIITSINNQFLLACDFFKGSPVVSLVVIDVDYDENIEHLYECVWDLNMTSLS